MKPTRTRRSKKQKALRSAGRIGRKAAKAKAVQKAPKTAATVWAGRRSGKLLKAGALALLGLVTLKALRGRRSKASGFAESATPPPPTAAPMPAAVPSPPPTASTPPVESSSATPPHGDPLAPNEGGPGHAPASDA